MEYSLWRKWVAPFLLALAPVTLLAVPAGKTCSWTGAGGNALASTAANWEGGAAPAAGDDVVLGAAGADHPMEWDLDIPVNSWTQDGYTNVVTIGTAYGDKGFTNLVIRGDCALMGGIWKHKNNGATEQYRLRASIGGDLTLGPDAWISADGLGLAQGYRPAGMGHTPDQTGGAYGSQASTWRGNFQFQKPYGDVCKPENLGSGGAWGDSDGGGAVYLEIAGRLRLDGRISAGARAPCPHYSGSGGSVYARAGSIEGSGTISADSATTLGAAGSGGRVAIVLTDEGAGFSGYDVVAKVSAVSRTKDIGAPGTIYAETAQDGPGHGWLVMKGAGIPPPRYPEQVEAHVISGDGRLEFSRVTLTNRVVVSLLEGTTLDLSSARPEAGDAPGVVNGFRLSGGRIVGPAGGPMTIDYRLIADKVADVRLEAPSLVFTNAGLLEVAVPSSIASDVTFAAGGALLAAAPLSVGGDLVLAAGSAAYAPGPAPVDPVPLDLTVAGDCSIEEGAMIDMCGRGYDTAHGPGFKSGSCGGSHGGMSGHPVNDGTPAEPYDSPRDPSEAGSGGFWNPGGGAVILRVGGDLLLDGEINVTGRQKLQQGSWYYGGAGGTVNITAGSLAGAGLIDASVRMAATGGTAGGGRIAVALTKPDATFGAFRGTMTAAGCPHAWAGGEAGGAGTIYLRERGQGIDEGTLVIDNQDRSPCAPTILGGGTAPRISCGSVVVRKGGALRLAENAMLSLSGDFTNGASFLASAGSSVSFTGTGPSLVSGDSTFCGFAGNAPGKTISFAAGSTQCVTGLLALAGSGASRLVLRSTEPGTPWNLSAAGPVSVWEVHVTDSDASSGDAISAANSEDGGNNSNWSFQATIPPGEGIAWAGTESPSWEDAANWTSGRLPVATDNVTVPAGAPFQPVLGGLVRVAGLAVSAGASLALSGRDLAVEGDCLVDGRLVASGSETIAVGGNLRLAGLVPALSTVVLDGAGDQSLSAPGVRFNAIRIAKSAGAALFQTSLGAISLACGDGSAPFDLAFAPGTTVSVNSLALYGDPVSRNGTLRSMTPGDRWKLDVSGYAVSGVTVRDSDASPGVALYPADSADGGNNLGWFFSDARKRWTGAADGDFSNAANWSGGAVPGADDDVYVEGARPLSLGGVTALGSVTVGPAATLSASDGLRVARSVTVEGGGTLVWNRPGAIGGNLVLLEGASMTHDANGVSDENNKIDLVVHGNGYIAPGAVIDVTGKGYAKGGGPGCPNGNTSSSHGGRGFNSGDKAACYGSIVSPTNCGSAGSSGWGDTPGGGAVRLSFGGALTLDGDVVADGIGFDPETGQQGHYNGTGGSVLLTAGMLAGAGRVFARGGDYPEMRNESGGGRVAVKITSPDADFGSFTGVLSARGGQQLDGILRASPGTVYTELPGQSGGRGLVLVEGGRTGVGVSSRMTDFPSPRLCEEGETEKTSVLVTGEAVLHLTSDTTVEDIRLEGPEPILRLNGHTLTVRSKQHPLGELVTKDGKDAQVTYSDGGKIVWIPHDLGLILMFR